MLNQYIKHLAKPVLPDDTPTKLILTRGARTAMAMLTEITIATLKDPDVLKVMKRVDNAVRQAVAENRLEMMLRWEDFKIFHIALEKKMANPTIKEPLEGRLAQQELLDACYEAEYQTIKAKRES